METPTTVSTPSPKTASITLDAGGSTMRLLAVRRPDGSATSSVVVTDEKGKNTRGMTETHASMEVARKALDVMAGKAEKLGWARRAPRRGFVARPDAFSSLPSAPKMAPVKKGA